METIAAVGAKFNGHEKIFDSRMTNRRQGKWLYPIDFYEMKRKQDFSANFYFLAEIFSDTCWCVSQWNRKVLATNLVLEYILIRH